MKKLLVGLLVLTSISSFASDNNATRSINTNSSDLESDCKQLGYNFIRTEKAKLVQALSLEKDRLSCVSRHFIKKRHSSEFSLSMGEMRWRGTIFSNTEDIQTQIDGHKLFIPKDSTFFIFMDGIIKIISPSNKDRLEMSSFLYMGKVPAEVESQNDGLFSIELALVSPESKSYSVVGWGLDVTSRSPVFNSTTYRLKKGKSWDAVVKWAYGSKLDNRDFYSTVTLILSNEVLRHKTKINGRSFIIERKTDDMGPLNKLRASYHISNKNGFYVSGYKLIETTPY